MKPYGLILTPGKKLLRRIKGRKWTEWSPGNKQRAVWVKTNKGKVEIREMDTFCMDCKEKRPEFFMVHDEVWHEAGFTKVDDGIICIFCFKKRLGRPLKIEDFTFNQMNDVIHALDGRFGRPYER
jgi:hypothetical protein